LGSLLARWLPASAMKRAPANGADAAARQAAAPRSGSLDQAVLDNIRAIDEDGTVLNEVIGMFLQEAPEQVAALRQALAAGDAGELGRIVHAMKSASFNVGAQALGELCRRLERHGKAGDITAAADVVPAIETLLGNLQPLL